MSRCFTTSGGGNTHKSSLLSNIDSVFKDDDAPHPSGTVRRSLPDTLTFSRRLHDPFLWWMRLQPQLTMENVLRLTSVDAAAGISDIELPSSMRVRSCVSCTSSRGNRLIPE